MQDRSGVPRLTGMHLLIVEDEILVAGDLAQYFEERGASILGPAPTMEAAQAHLEAADAAILDVNVNGTMVFPIADRLLEKGVPFVFFTGYDDVIPARLRHVGHVRKSGGRQALLKTLSAAHARARDGADGPAEEAIPDIAGLLPRLRLRARHYLSGEAAADRLVEHTLTAAIVAAGNRPADREVFEWLCDLMAKIVPAMGPRLLD